MKFSFKQIVAAFFLIGGTFLMLTLGTWQLQRLEWKQGIIEKLNQEYAKAGNPPRLSLEEIKNAKEDIIYGSIKGHFIHDKELLFGPKPHDGSIGYHVLTPLKTTTGTILVNRGWIDEKDKDQLPNAHLNGEVTVTGIIRTPDWNSFTPNNNPQTDVWTKLNVSQIGQIKQLKKLSSKILYLDKALSNDGMIKLVHQKWYPRNKHKQYAIFWFSMAFIFLGFFVLYARSEKKKLVKFTIFFL